MAKLIGRASLLVSALWLISCGQPHAPEESSLFAGLSTENSLGKEVQPGYQIEFPRDHASHPEFAIEWWYLTANLKDKKGNGYPLQWTLFRFKGDHSKPPWADDQMYMAHGKISSAEGHWFEEKFARGGVGNAGVENNPFNAFLDNWQWRGETAHLLPATLTLALSEGVGATLTLTTDSPFVFHGDNGFSKKVRKGKQASYYYSQPFIQAEGELNLPTGKVSVRGSAWFDHEWTSQYLASGTVGWDWFSIHLEDGSKLMLFNLRLNDDDFWSGSWISPLGDKRHLEEKDIAARITKREMIAGRSIPLEWKLSVLEQDLVIKPFKKAQWNQGRFSYYEGAISVSGTLKGEGFMELTGY